MLYTIENVDIVLTMPDDTTQAFTLEAPNGNNPFEFGFAKLPVLPVYRDGNLNLQTGHTRYQFIGMYRYETHEMDLRLLLVAKKIELRFPPAFTDSEDYQAVDVLLSNTSALKNYLGNLPGGNAAGDIMPSGGVNLEFVGKQPLNDGELKGFGFYQDEVAAPLPGEGALYKVDFVDFSITSHFTNKRIVTTVGDGGALQVVNTAEYNFKIIAEPQPFMRVANQSGGGGNFIYQVRKSAVTIFGPETQDVGPNAPCGEGRIDHFFFPVEGLNEVREFVNNGRLEFTLTDENFGSGTVCGKRSEFSVYVRFLGISDSEVTRNTSTGPNESTTITLIEDLNE